MAGSRRARLFADQCFPLPVVEELRQLGHDVVTALEANQETTEDSTLLAFAHRDGRAVLTHNRTHFRNIHRQNQLQGGVIICTQDSNHKALADRIDFEIAAAGSLAGKLIRVVRPPR